MTVTTPSSSRLRRFCRDHGLPDGYVGTARQAWWPLARWTADQAAARAQPFVLAINGAQASGKSTLAALLVDWLASFGLRPLTLSLDDLYLTRDGRARLAADVHPLLATRGVPGTHDVALGVELFDALVSAGPSSSIAIPRFDKGRDDRLPEGDWPRFAGRPDVIVFEGWCVGARPERGSRLVEPVNALERDGDPDGNWRRYVNDRLGDEYADWFRWIDALAMLAAPSFESVIRWRSEAERKLAGCGDAFARRVMDNRVMDDGQLRRFMMHFERLTRHQLRTVPEHADWLFRLAPDRSVDDLCHMQRRT